MGEDGDGVGRLRPEYIRLIRFAIVAVIVIVALVLVVPFVQDALRAPRITVTETSVERQPFPPFGCTSQTYIFTFRLVNSGDADGFANVQFHIDGVSMANSNYFIPAGQSIPGRVGVSLPDCNAHTTEVVLVSTWKA